MVVDSLNSSNGGRSESISHGSSYSSSSAKVGSKIRNFGQIVGSMTSKADSNVNSKVTSMGSKVKTAVGSAKLVTGKVMDTVSASPMRAHRQPSIEGFRGVFHTDHGGSKPSIRRAGDRRTSQVGVAKSVDFRQRLDLLLATEENARTVARKLYERFEGDTKRLESFYQLLEDKWGFPRQVFQQLSMHLRRATNQDDPPFVGIEEWAVAFLRWLQSLKALSGRTKVTRQCLIQSRSGSYLRETYLQGAKLGAGAFGEVHMILHKSLGVARVVKIVGKSQFGAATTTIEGEVNLLKSLDHPHIVRIFETFETPDDLNIIMDYAEGGDLAGVIKDAGQERIPEWWGKAATDQMASALAYMHSRAVIHCDLKPANVMLLHGYDSDAPELPHCLLVDFGLAEIFQERNLGERAKVKGTPLYLAPEGFDGHLTQKSDMWAVGCMIYELLLGRRPFKEHKSLFVLWSQIAKTQPQMDDLPPLAAEVVSGLMAKEAKDRPTAQQCRLQEWFADNPDEYQPPVTDATKIKRVGHIDYFQRSVMFSVASGLSMKDMRHLYDVFMQIDKGKTGHLNMEELTEGLQMLGIKADPKALMTVMDLDQSGDISYTEFLAGALQTDTDLTERLVQYAFDMFDLDGDGYISMHELKLMLSGDGPLVDVLPDGKTVGRVMDELSDSAGRITFEQFRKYMGKQGTASVGKFRGSVRSVESANAQGMLIRELEQQESEDDREKKPQIGSFHFWLQNLMEETTHGATFGYGLMFLDTKLEATYVAQEITTTCRQIMLLSSLLVVYSLWSVITSDFAFKPTIDDWDNEVIITHNLGWMFLAFSAAVIAWACCRRAKVVGWTRDGDTANYDTSAVRFEIFLCAWACLVPWVSCYFANRFRVAALFGRSASGVFHSMNSDSDLVMAMVGTLTFFSTRTYVRFAGATAIGLSCFFAYATSTAMFGISTPGCANDANWVWPGLLLMCLLLLVLSGHRAVEYYRRLTFLSLYHSYIAIKQIEEGEDDGESVPFIAPVAADQPQEESKLKRFRTSLDLVHRFCETRELGSRPLRNALRTLASVLQEVRDDIVDADRWAACDVREALRVNGIAGNERDAVLMLFDEEATPTQLPWQDAEQLRCTEIGAPEESAALKAMGSHDEFPLEAWGWDTLDVSDNPLLHVGDDLIFPVVEGDLGPDAERRARIFVELLLRAYLRNPHSAEARAALSVRAAHWFARTLRLWKVLAPVERVALLVAAAGLHCESGAATFSEEALVARVAATSYTLEALDKSGLVVDENRQWLRHLVGRAIMRSRPRCLLEDANALRIEVNKHGRLPASAVDRSVIISLLVGTASFSFLALPTELHEPWAYVCQEEASLSHLPQVTENGADFDIAIWLKGLIEVLMLPMCETLGGFEGVGPQIHDVGKCLNENAKVWKVNKLATYRSPEDEDYDCPDYVENDNAEHSILRQQNSLEVLDHRSQPELHDEHLLTRSPPSGVQHASSPSTVPTGMMLPGECDPSR